MIWVNIHNTLYKIRTHDEFVVVWVSKDLDNKISRQNVGIGMKLLITFNGLMCTDNGFDMEDFSVEILD